VPAIGCLRDRCLEVIRRGERLTVPDDHFGRGTVGPDQDQKGSRNRFGQ
jgi:hypothetical protein